MEIQNKILSSTKFVIDNSSFVNINEQKINELSEKFSICNGEHWIKHAPFDIYKLNEEQIANFLLVMHSIGFCFWGSPKWTIDYNGQYYDGSFGLFAALGRAIENGYAVLDFDYLSGISEEDLDKVLEGNIQIPLFHERLNFLRETAKIVNQKFDGSFLNVLNDVKTDNNLLNIIATSFPNFSDAASYKGENIYFYKRAQLLVSDIFHLISKDVHKIDNISSLTTCADYKIPQVLRTLGIFQYRGELSSKVDSQIEIEKGSEFEVEIRANTIWAVEKIKSIVGERHKNISSIEVNEQLWVSSQDNSGMKPYHRTRTTSY